MIGENPYYHRNPIREVEHFYGRARETVHALRMLKKGQSVSIVGPRRIGKTSFLFHLSDPTVRAGHGTSPDESLFVYIDGEMLGVWSKADVLCFIFQETASRADQKKTDPSSIVDYRSFERAINGLLKPGQQLVYLIDEFDCLGNNRNLDADFFSFLRSLTVRYNVAYATASKASLFALIDSGILSSPFFNIFFFIHLGLFGKDDARQMIREPSQAAGLEFSTSTENFILDLGGHYPFFLQITCFHAFELLCESPSFDGHVRRQLEKNVQADLKSHFEYFASKLKEEERRVLARLHNSGENETSTEALEALEQKCLTHQGDEGYTFVSRAFAHFVEQEIGTTLEASVADGDRRMATVLFVDVVGFTPMTERHLPEEMLKIMQPALRMFVDIVDRHRGKVANFGGDSVMALFGVPTGQADDAVRAVRAALEIQSNVASYAGKLKRDKGISFSARVGLDTGVVVLGKIGGGQRAEFTALGDPVNLACRLEAKAYPGTVVISNHTYQQVRGRFRTKSLGSMRIKGKSRPIRAYRVLEEKIK